MGKTAGLKTRHYNSGTGSVETRKNVTQLFGVLADHGARVVFFVKTS
jgi:hypothetical protein